MQPTDSPASSVFSKNHPELGSFSLCPLEPGRDMPLIHSWVSRDYARYWGMVGQSLEQVTSGYREIAQTAQVFLGYWQGRPTFLVETYFPGDDPVAADRDRVAPRHRLVAGEHPRTVDDEVRGLRRLRCHRRRAARQSTPPRRRTPIARGCPQDTGRQSLKNREIRTERGVCDRLGRATIRALTNA